MATSNKLAEFAASLEPRVRDAFVQSVRNLRHGADLRSLIEAIERRDVQAAFNALRIEAAAFEPLDRIITESFRQAGGAAAADIGRVRSPSGAVLEVRFDGRDPQAERWARDHSSTLITDIVADTMETVRATIGDGIQSGHGGRRVALDIVGRTDRRTGEREGGALGLTSQQAQYVIDYRRELMSGDPALLRKAIERGRRDKRFDRTVIKAIDGVKPLDAETIGRMVTRYKDGLLQLRGEVVARTETMNSTYAARHETYRQAVARGEIKDEWITKTWITAADARVRDAHMALHRTQVKGLNTPFMATSKKFGSVPMLHPHQEGAPADQVVACRCDCRYRINHIEAARGR